MYYLGIDVAKAKLDCLLFDPVCEKRKSKSVANSPDGIASLLKTLRSWGFEVTGLHVVMEPSSVYHELAAYALHDAGCIVCLVNPANVRNYAKSIGIRTKTDAVDAAVLARYGATQKLRAWQPPPPEARALRALLTRRDAIAEDLQRERNRGEKSDIAEVPEPVLKSIEQGVEFLEKQLRSLQKEIDQHIDNNPDLKDKQKLLLSIPGVGERVAQNMTALLSVNDFQNAEAMAAYLGLVPVEKQSGTSIKARPHMSKAGPAALRQLLYMPAIVATKYNPHIRAMYKKLLGKGKSKMSAIGAAMRKLAHLCFGVLHSGQPYDPNFKSKSA